MSDFSVRKRTVGAGDQSWLGSAHGVDSARTVTIARSALVKNTHYPNGYLLSGLPLCKGSGGTAGKYIPYTGDTGQVFDGLLLTAQDVPDNSTGDIVAPMFQHGIVREPNLPVAVNSAGKTAVAGRITFISETS